jgi:hypothetical protein
MLYLSSRPGSGRFIRHLLFSAFACSSFFLLSSCKKDTELAATLPEVTDHGANTFGMVINGKVVSARGSENISGGIYADMNPDSCGLCYLPPDSSDLFLRIKHKDFPTTYLFFPDPRHIREWRLNQASVAFWEFGKPRAYMECNGVRSSLNTDGFMRSNFAGRNDWIFSAEFSFECTNPKTCETFSVRNGRMDVNLRSISYFP